MPVRLFLQRGFLALSIVLIIGVLAIYGWLKSTVPDYSKTLESAHLSASVTITRDAAGVPHIEAAAFNDAAFAMGYVQAQDRMWQMEIIRRGVQARTAELFGDAFVETDLLYGAAYDYPGIARRSEERLDDDTRETFEKFAEGVNLAIDAGQATASPEWFLFGVTPEPWTASDVNNLMTFISDTATDGDRELKIAAMKAALSPEKFEFATAPLPASYPTLYRDFGALDGAMDPAGVGDGKARGGTNFFAFAPGRTTTGGAVLAVDPHLPLHAPSLVYPVVVNLPDDFIAGGAWIGSPAVVFGQNSRIAWGMTHLYADTTDYIVERVDPQNPDRYLTPTGAAPFEVEEVEIAVKGGAPARRSIRRTRHGVVVSDLVSAGGETLTGGGLAAQFKAVEDAFGPGHVLVRRQLAVEEGHTTIQSTLKVSRARNWTEFRDALRDYEWTNNFVFADRDGNIGVQMAARIPVRRRVNGWNGQRLARGWLGEGAWDGYAPFDDLPYIFNPAQGYVADANSRAVPADFPLRVTDNFASPWRVRRAYDLIDAKDRHSLASIAEIQLDVYSYAAATLIPALERVNMRSEKAKSAMRMLTAWDRMMAQDKPEPLLYAAVELALQQRLVNAHDVSVARRHGDALLLTRILTEGADWCDHPDTEAVESCEDAVNEAIDAAVAAVASEHGNDMARWRWGREHIAHFSAPYSWANAPVLDTLTATRLPAPGGEGTLNLGGGYITSAPFDNLLEGLSFDQGSGATFRMIADLRDPKRSLFMFAPGQSGNVMSPHWNDLAKRWAAGEYFSLHERDKRNSRRSVIRAVAGSNEDAE